MWQMLNELMWSRCVADAQWAHVEQMCGRCSNLHEIWKVGLIRLCEMHTLFDIIFDFPVLVISRWIKRFTQCIGYSCTKHFSFCKYCSQLTLAIYLHLYFIYILYYLYFFPREVKIQCETFHVVSLSKLINFCSPRKPMVFWWF